jgi:hypothetical protein
MYLIALAAGVMAVFIILVRWWEGPDVRVTRRAQADRIRADRKAEAARRQAERLCGSPLLGHFFIRDFGHERSAGVP